MKLLIDQSKLNVYKRGEPIPLECEGCHKTFYSEKRKIQTSLKHPEINALKYCSQKCFQSQRYKWSKQITTQCKQCQLPIKKLPWETKFSKFNFCSRSCKATYWNNHKVWGYKRSKLERWIEEQLTLLYPLLKIKYNQTTEINSELDIYIPSLKLAFELNGIFHYEPIYGIKKLEQKQTNDSRKFKKCIEKSIGLCIIDTTSMVHFKLEKATKFLSIIRTIIDEEMKTRLESRPTHTPL